MMRLKCRWLYDNGFRDGQLWRDGEILQFLYASNKTAYGVVLPALESRPVLVELNNLKIEPQTPQESE
jgi:hypothetical protein